MKKLTFTLILALAALMACKTNIEQTPEGNASLGVLHPDTSDRNNDFYDNLPLTALPGGEISVEGEVTEPGMLDLAVLPVRSVIVKEAVFNVGTDTARFVGAYRYDGYSLFDILKDKIINKKNLKEFRPIIDLYLEISNDQGDMVVVSWGEVFYPEALHQCLIATAVSRIVPTKTKELWPLPEKRKLIISNDLVTERNITNPTRIVVKSFVTDVPAVKGLKPLFSSTCKLVKGGKVVETLDRIPDGIAITEFPTVFYGRGTGIHGITRFRGANLKDIIGTYAKPNHANLQGGKVIIYGFDGYRAVFSLSEIINRNDYALVLMVCDPDLKDGGIFRLLPAADFFSDRAVKAISMIEIVP